MWNKKNDEKSDDALTQGGKAIDVLHLPATMKAAVLHGPRTIRIDHVPVPQPAPDEVLVAVDAVGLCGSDVRCYTGERTLAYPMVLGHEIAGHIVAMGANVPAQRLAERVVIEPNIPCGECALCVRKLGRICVHKQSLGITRWGGLAEYVTVPDPFAWSVPEAVDLRDAVTIEPTAVAVHALSRAQVEPGATIAVIGCGGVGLLLATVAIAEGYRVVAIEPNAARRSAVLAAGALSAWDIDDVQEARTLFGRAGVNTLFECAGLPATTQLCLEAAPQGSCIILVGLAIEDVALNPLRFVHNELEVRGAYIYEHPIDFAKVIDLVASGKLAPGSTAGQLQPLESVATLLEGMACGELGAKPLIAVQSAPV